MLYLIHGTDSTKAREKLRALVDSLVEKKPDASLTFVDAESATLEELNDLIYGQGLFERKRLIVCDRILENGEVKEVILENLKEIADSDNVFVFLEREIDTATLKRLEKKADKVQVFDTKEKKKERFDIFSLTDAFGKRDRKKLWTLYQKAKWSGVSSEEIHGILFWQLKAMLLANEASEAGEANLNPFVFRKSKSFLQNYTKEELHKLSSELVNLYHEARRGAFELDIGLELFLLKSV